MTPAQDASKILHQEAETLMRHVTGLNNFAMALHLKSLEPTWVTHTDDLIENTLDEIILQIIKEAEALQASVCQYQSVK